MDFDFSLLSQKCKVVFIKKNGEERTMICSNNLEKIPSEKHPKGTGTQTSKKPGLHKVFDFEKEEWRSFNEDQVISLELYKEEEK